MMQDIIYHVIIKVPSDATAECVGTFKIGYPFVNLVKSKIIAKLNHEKLTNFKQKKRTDLFAEIYVLFCSCLLTFVFYFVLSFIMISQRIISAFLITYHSKEKLNLRLTHYSYLCFQNTAERNVYKEALWSFGRYRTNFHLIESSETVRAQKPKGRTQIL